MDEISALFESVEADERPVEDAREFIEKSTRQGEVFAPVKTIDQLENDEARGECATDIGEARQLVRDNEKADLHLPGPSGAEFTINGDAVLAVIRKIFSAMAC